MKSDAPRKRGRSRRLLIAAASVLPEVVVLKRRGYGVAGNVMVRCRAGHLFTTIWVPGVSVKSVRLAWWRFQRCPVGSHWSLVTPVRQSDLTEEARLAASEHRDLWIP